MHEGWNRFIHSLETRSVHLLIINNHPTTDVAIVNTMINCWVHMVDVRAFSCQLSMKLFTRTLFITFWSPGRKSLLTHCSEGEFSHLMNKQGNLTPLHCWWKKKTPCCQGVKVPLQHISHITHLLFGKLLRRHRLIKTHVLVGNYSY